MLSPLVTCYLFLGGAGGGALVLICVLELLARFPLDVPRDYLAHCQLQGRTCLFCFVALALGAFCLCSDLGRLDNIAVLLISPKPTPLTVGAFSLALSLVCTAVLVLEKLFEFSPPWLFRVAVRIFGLLCGLLTIGYTGVLLGSSAAVVAWQSPLIPVLFVLSSLSSGLALFFAAAAFTDRTFSSSQLVGTLLNADSVIMVLEAMVLTAFVLFAMGDPSSAPGARALVQGELAPSFWGMLAVVGIMAPLLLERSPLRLEAGRLLVLSLCVLAGAAALRYCTVGLADFDPSQLYAVSQYAGAAVFNG